MKQFDIHQDIYEARRRFPLLKEVITPGSIKLVGEIELLHPDTGKFIDIFRVEIIYPECFPFCFPKVIELDEKIPRTLERHIMPHSHTICFAVQIEELLLCQTGINSLWFIDNILLPRLAEEYIVSNGGKYRSEYSHNRSGANWEYFMKRFKTTDHDLILNILKSISEKQLPKGDRPCFCGSNMIYSKCHKKEVQFLRQIKLEFVKNIYEELKSNPYNGADL